MKQMDYTNTQAGVAKVSLLTIGAQAMMDAYLCLLHLTLGIVMEQLFNAFATASFFQFVTFSLFEMRFVHTAPLAPCAGSVAKPLGHVASLHSAQRGLYIQKLRCSKVACLFQYCALRTKPA